MGEGEKLEGGKEFKVDEETATQKMEEEFEESSKYFWLACWGRSFGFTRGKLHEPQTSCHLPLPRLFSVARSYNFTLSS